MMSVFLCKMYNTSLRTKIEFNSNKQRLWTLNNFYHNIFVGCVFIITCLKYFFFYSTWTLWFGITFPIWLYEYTTMIFENKNYTNLNVEWIIYKFLSIVTQTQCLCPFFMLIKNRYTLSQYCRLSTYNFLRYLRMLTPFCFWMNLDIYFFISLNRLFNENNYSNWL